MRANLKPATPRARGLLRKLQALAERGVDGERTSAQQKIARLQARYDFSIPEPADRLDLFVGTFRPSAKARPIYTFSRNEFDLANSVKWAIESATKISCRHRDCELVAEATVRTASQLTRIADHIANSFRTLLDRFNALDGVNTADRRAFVMGLYDGMMNQPRESGQRLPGRPLPKKGRKTRQPVASGPASGLNVHPYTLALGLGRQIRFSAPLQNIIAELDAETQKRLGPKTP